MSQARLGPLTRKASLSLSPGRSCSRPRVQERVPQGPTDPHALLWQLLEAIEQGGGERRRRRRRQTERLKPYVAAQVDVLPETFTLGDKKSYRGFYNRPLSPDLSYQCFVLASLKEPVDQVCPRPQPHQTDTLQAHLKHHEIPGLQ